MGEVSNRKELKSVRRSLRSSGTSSEAVLWKCLSGNKLDGRKFRRQHSVGPFVLDFYCPSERLCVEVDGGAHQDPTSSVNDGSRDRYLADLGIRVVRIDNKDVIDDLDGVKDMIRSYFI
jgi:very-short-patch-repair endonuclease